MFARGVRNLVYLIIDWSYWSSRCRRSSFVMCGITKVLLNDPLFYWNVNLDFQPWLCCKHPHNWMNQKQMSTNLLTFFLLVFLSSAACSGLLLNLLCWGRWIIYLLFFQRPNLHLGFHKVLFLRLVISIVDLDTPVLDMWISVMEGQLGKL